MDVLCTRPGFSTQDSASKTEDEGAEGAPVDATRKGCVWQGRRWDKWQAAVMHDKPHYQSPNETFIRNNYIYIIDTYIDTIYMCINDAWHSTSTKLPNLDYSSLCHFSKSCENIELDAFLTCQFAEKAWRCDGAMPVVAKESCLGSLVRWSDWSVAAQTWRRSHLTCGVVHRFEA